MMNYIRSEIYRNVRNRNLKITIAIFTGLVLLLMVALIYLNKVDATFPYGNTRYAISNIYMQMPIFLVVLVFLSAIIDNNEFRNHTIKHSVAFGISRNTIYLGRFLVQAIVCTIVYAVMAALLVVLSFAFLTHSNVGELGLLIRVSLGGYTCLLAALSIAYYFIMNQENQSTAIACSIAILLILPIILNMAGRKIEIIKKLAWFFPYNQLNFDGPLASIQGNPVTGIVGATLIGIVWLGAFLALGMIRFSKREVK